MNKVDKFIYDNLPKDENISNKQKYENVQVLINTMQTKDVPSFYDWLDKNNYTTQTKDKFESEYIANIL